MDPGPQSTIMKAAQPAPQRPTQILIADDDPVSRRLLQSRLNSWGYDVRVAADGTEAMALLEDENPPELAILDWQMPGMDGLEVCSRLRARPAASYTYVILLTARDGKEDLITALDAGVDDYLAKPFHPGELRARLRAGQRVLELQARLLAAKAELEIRATHDVLTGVLNRAGINEGLRREFARSCRDGTPIAVLLLDVDHFKRVNDSLGHDAGDEVLRETTRRIGGVLRVSDLLGRYGGEEFLVVLPSCDLQAATAVAERIRHAIGDSPMELERVCRFVTASLGVAAASNATATTIAQLIKSADEALYRAKGSGRNRVAA